MTVTIVPKAALAPTQRVVGILWLVNGVLAIDHTTMDDADFKLSQYRRRQDDLGGGL